MLFLFLTAFDECLFFCSANCILADFLLMYCTVLSTHLPSVVWPLANTEVRPLQGAATRRIREANWSSRVVVCLSYGGFRKCRCCKNGRTGCTMGVQIRYTTYWFYEINETNTFHQWLTSRIHPEHRPSSGSCHSYPSIERSLIRPASKIKAKPRCAFFVIDAIG